MVATLGDESFEIISIHVRYKQMKNGATLRWGVWHEEKDMPLQFPSGWEIIQCNPRGGPDVGSNGLKDAFRNPIGTPPIAEMARGQQSAVIVTDDLSRPTPSERLIPLVIEELIKGGVSRDRISIIMGIASHHTMSRPEIFKKIGRDVAEQFSVRNHNVFDNLDYLGQTSNKTPVYLNKEFMRADVKICVGSILPHGLAGFSGGAKLVLPGVAGIETIYQNHRDDNGYTRGLCNLEGNVMRADMEEVAAMGGLNAIVNVVLNDRRGIIGCVVGQFIEAHRAGCEIAQRAYATRVPKEWDAIVLGAYPKDTEWCQAPSAFAVADSAVDPLIHDKGTVIIGSATTEGAGIHFLMGPGMRLGPEKRPRRQEALGSVHRPLYFSPNVTGHDLEQWGGRPDDLRRTWDGVLKTLQKRHGDRARIAVFPCASMQLGTETI